LLLLYREVFDIDLPWLENIIRLTSLKRIPVALTEDAMGGLVWTVTHARCIGSIPAPTLSETVGGFAPHNIKLTSAKRECRMAC
jgi:hypothetical protein